jgi:GNAT superfamily N-acetyltransferase
VGSTPSTPGHPARPASASIRPATAADAPRIWDLLREFAVYEKLADLVTGDAERLSLHLSHEAWPSVDGLLAEDGGEAVGYALYFGTFSSFWTAPMVWLEDLYVRPSHRGSGVGLALIRAVARAALERGCTRVTWAVLDWNEPAIEFYRRLGASRQSEWHVYELEGERLRALVANDPGPSGSASPSPPGTSRTT